MDYLTKIRKEHELIQGMLAVFKELIDKLSKAKAVNLLDLEDIHHFWSEYFESQHLSWEENDVFSYLRKINHPLLAQLIQAHEEIRNRLVKLREVIKKLRSGRPNSGRELVKNGENFLWLLEAHLRDENKVIEELEEKEDEFISKSTQDIGIPSPEEERIVNQKELPDIIERLSSEYLGKNIGLNWFAHHTFLHKPTDQVRIDTGRERQGDIQDDNNILIEVNETGFEETPDKTDDVEMESADYVSKQDESETTQKESL